MAEARLLSCHFSHIPYMTNEGKRSDWDGGCGPDVLRPFEGEKGLLLQNTRVKVIYLGHSKYLLRPNNVHKSFKKTLGG